MLLWAPTLADIAAAPAPGQPPPANRIPTALTNPVSFLLPIYPGRNGSSVVWESAVEMEPTLMMGLMNGVTTNTAAGLALTAPRSPSLFTVVPVIDYADNQSDIFKPAVNDWFYLQEINRTSTGLAVGNGGWQRLTITP